MYRIKLRSVLQNFLLILAILFVGLGMTELSLRLIDYYPRVLIPPYLYENHPRTWWTLRPNFSAEIDTPDGHVIYQINSQGIRAPYDFDPRSEYTLRCLFIVGDSATFGWGVNEEYTFPRVLNDSLARQEIPVEVINFGVPGFGTMHSYERLLEYSSFLGRPNYVIYAFSANDPIDNISGKKVVVNGIRIDEHRPNKALLSQIALVYHQVRVVSWLFDFYYNRFGNPRNLKKAQLESTHTSVENREDFLLTLKYLLKIIHWTNQNNVALLVLITSYSEYSAPLIEMLSVNEIPVITSEDIFAQFNTDHRSTRLIDGHWNENGHQFIAAGLETLIVQRWLTKN